VHQKEKKVSPLRRGVGSVPVDDGDPSHVRWQHEQAAHGTVRGAVGTTMSRENWLKEHGSTELCNFVLVQRRVCRREWHCEAVEGGGESCHRGAGHGDEGERHRRRERHASR
jgi:hypothetical protein